MSEIKDIIFEEHWYNETCDETEIYFEAPVSYLDGKYPEADGCTFLLHFLGSKWDDESKHFASVEISPFEDYEDERTDYDWSYYLCDPEFKQTLYDIYENRGKENS